MTAVAPAQLFKSAKPVDFSAAAQLAKRGPLSLSSC